MDAKLSGRVAVVTGGGRGVGRAIAEALGDAGAAVAVIARNRDKLSEVVAQIEKKNGRGIALTADVTKEPEVNAAMSRVEGEFGPIDVLVNNAGSCNALGPVWEVDPSAWWRDVEVNLRGTFLCSRAVLPGMLDRGSGRIINVSTYATIRPDPYRSAYASAKLGVLRFTDSVAAEVGGRGVRVFAIAPGTVQTAMTDRLQAVANEHDWPVDWPTAAATKWCPPEKAGALVVFLASGRGDALTGRFLHALDDVADLARQADTIRQQDLYAIRLRTP
jgi:NAD(P)-dependent dehydrogenase (short-subunit alcohol dehydrogenase family)